VDFLPDSRTRERKGAIQTPDGWAIPVYCANCGTPWGMVPERHMTFAFVLCDPCAETIGDVAHFHREPDAVFWDKVAHEMVMAKIASHEDVVRETSDESTPIGKLAKEWNERLRREL